MIGAIKYYHKHRNLLYNFVLRDLRGKYAGSSFGLFWAVAQPLIFLGVYTLVFSVILKISMKPESPDFPTRDSALLIFCGMVPWIAFAEGLQRATTSIVDNANLIKKVAFPAAILPAHIVISSMLNMVIGMAIIVGAMLILKGAISAALLFLPVILLLQFVFTAGLALFFCGANVFFRDTAHIVNMLIMIWMFCTPIFYPAEMIYRNPTLPKIFADVYRANPMALLVQAYRNIFYDGALPQAHVIGALAAWAVIAFLIGYLTFRRAQWKFADLV
jgi:ABC-type polysaccharide/polyol phosphate export permease